MNNLRYDPCEYSQAVNQSVSPLSYILDPIRYENYNKCRPELGIVGGTAVSHVSGNLVDLENNLIGIDRPGIQCAAYMHHPPAPGEAVRGAGYLFKPCPKPVDTTMLHLPSCQFSSYPATPLPTVPMPAPQGYACPR